MKTLSMMVTFIASLAGMACSNVNPRSSLDSDSSEEPEEFVVQIGEEAQSAPNPLLGVVFYGDGRTQVELAFDVTIGTMATSLIVQSSLAQLQQRTFEAALVDGPLVEGTGNWFVDGEPMNGAISVTIEEHGRISGTTVMTTRSMSFSGQFLLSCTVPQAELPRGDANEASNSPGSGLPPIASGETLSENLVYDQMLVSPNCQALSALLLWP